MWLSGDFDFSIMIVVPLRLERNKMIDFSVVLSIERM